MDFSNRNSQQPQAVRPASTGGSLLDDGDKKSSGGKNKKFKVSGGDSVLKFGTAILFLAVAILLIAAIASFMFSSKPKSQDSIVKSSELQAVFLTNGQVYFGNISDLNSSYISLKNVYYLQNNTDQTSKNAPANQNVSLVKLGCELHAPQDQMIINTDQVTFWENLKSDGQVAQAVAKYQKTNPDGKCSTTPAASNSTPTTDNTTTTPTTPTTNNTTTNTANETKKP